MSMEAKSEAAGSGHSGLRFLPQYASLCLDSTLPQKTCHFHRFLLLILQYPPTFKYLAFVPMECSNGCTSLEIIGVTLI